MNLDDSRKLESASFTLEEIDALGLTRDRFDRSPHFFFDEASGTYQLTGEGFEIARKSMMAAAKGINRDTKRRKLLLQLRLLFARVTLLLVKSRLEIRRVLLKFGFYGH